MFTLITKKTLFVISNFCKLTCDYNNDQMHNQMYHRNEEKCLLSIIIIIAVVIDYYKF